ncbi:uncharacterized protein [Anabrus simplex]|uniref:uncharacterized protein n=1 Tax=Anabrus simplex TaxID=316456 RepID=UPI0035A3C7CA
MGERAKLQKRSIDEIIEHMTADVQNNDGQYNPLGLTPPPTPASSPHIWSEYTSVTNANSGSVHSYIPHPSIVANCGENPVFFADYPPHYEMDISSHLSKQGEIPQQHGYYFAARQQQLGMLTENHDVPVIGTMMDVGGGNVVNVVYSGRPPADNTGGIVPQTFHMVSADGSRETIPHSLGGFVPYHQSAVIEGSGSSSIKDYGLFGGSERHHHPQQGRQLQHAQRFQTISSSNQAQLIENLVCNWVPNQSGTYSPFGCSDSGPRPIPSTTQQTTQTVSDHLELENDGKGINHGIRKPRIVAEVRPMRPTYSDVLTKSAPPSSVSQSSSVVKQNSSSQNSNSNKSENVGNVGKSKTVSVSKSNCKKNKSSVLKRQHSSGSDEHSGISAPVKIIQSPVTTRKSTGSESKHVNSTSFSSLPRKWVSLDDLDSDKQLGTKLHEEEVFQSEDNTTSRMSEDIGDSQAPKKAVGVATPRMKTGNHNDEKWDGVGATLNNHKPSAFTNGNKGPGGVNGSGTKRPIHINNNLGTSQWAAASASQPSGGVPGEKNVLKGSGGSTKNCKACTDEKKGNSSSSSASKPGSAGSNTTRNSSVRSNSTGGIQNGTNISEKVAQGKRNQRNKKKECHSPILLVCRPIRQHVGHWGRVALQVMMWFLHLLSDVLGMSTRLFAHLCLFSWEWLRLWSQHAWRKLGGVVIQMKFFEWLGFRQNSWWNFWRRGRGSTSGRASSSESLGNRFKDGFPPGLENNISLPATGDEAMKRLLACKGKDPYSILGVTPHSTDDDIKKYYKRQAFLVHPDKNNQPGAEEAFKILVHAFELIGEPERRKAYDHRVAETQQVEQAWSELSDLLSQLHQKMEYAANTIRCTNCGKRHRRISVDRPCYAARLCGQCKIHHAAREGDIWAESSMLGFLWHYYACMDGAVYDITEWAACQADNLRHLRANTHNVQYRIVLGKQQQQQQQQQSSSHARHRSSHHRSVPDPTNEQDLEDFLNNLYNHSTASGGNESTGSRGDQNRNRRKGKRKK